MTSLRADGLVEFRFYRPQVSRVSVAGTFNGWQDDALTMRKEQDGWWVAAARLPAGDHRFRYLADGHWFTDYASHGIEMGPKGIDSVLVVPRWLDGDTGPAKGSKRSRAN